MRLLEYQAKMLVARHGIPIPRGRLASSATEAKQVAEELGGRVVVKAQVAVTGRGKAGGIRLVKDAEEAQKQASLILGMNLKGFLVRKVLVDEAISIQSEIYLGITIDRSARKPVLIASASGGEDIENVASEKPEKVFKVYISPLWGLLDFQIRDIAVNIDLPRHYWREFLEIAQALWMTYDQNDAVLAEINPLVITEEGRLLALDAKMTIDDNALYRHSELTEMRDVDVDDISEIEARMHGLVYFKLEGRIGCLVNGAGLAMAMMDMINQNGEHPANFLDIGGGASAEKVVAALRILHSNSKVKAILVNIFGGITRCDEVAKGIITYKTETKYALPLVVRLIGTNAEEGIKLLENSGIICAPSIHEATQKIIDLIKEVEVE